jgi:hypothetical protein
MKSWIADPEKTSITRQQHDKHVPTVTDNYTTVEELLEAVFSMWSVLRLYKENQREFLVSRGCELVAVGSPQLAATGRFWLAGVWAEKYRSLHCWSHNQATPSDGYNKLRRLVSVIEICAV